MGFVTAERRAEILAELADMPTPTISEVDDELDAIAVNLGITWTAAERTGVHTAVRTRYARPGQRCGRGYVRKVSDMQVRLIKRLMAERDTTKLVRLPGSADIENMSLTGARDLIDRLMACSMRETPSPVQIPPTDKQASYLRHLASIKVVPDGLTVDPSKLTARGCSIAIEVMVKQPRKPVEEPAWAEKLTAGIYLVDGTVYKVQVAVHGSGALYAKRLVDGNFEYVPGSIRNIRPEHRMTLDQAKEYGKLYGVCIKCGRTLTDEKSIVDGIGPVCASRF